MNGNEISNSAVTIYKKEIQIRVLKVPKKLKLRVFRIAKNLKLEYVKKKKIQNFQYS